jgi:subtilase family protein
MNLKVAVVDSGINAEHSHIGKVVGGVSFVSDDWKDFIGHGTAVAAAICSHEPRVELYAVKIFDRSFATEIASVVKALEWCADNDMDVVNVSLATAKNEHAALLEQPTRRVNILIAPSEFMGLPAYPGSFEWCFGVASDPGCPRGEVRRSSASTYLASPLPRELPGVAITHNFSGSSFAVANITGLICRLMYDHDVRTRVAVRSLFS